MRKKTLSMSCLALSAVAILAIANVTGASAAKLTSGQELGKGKPPVVKVVVAKPRPSCNLRLMYVSSNYTSGLTGNFGVYHWVGNSGWSSSGATSELIVHQCV